MAKLKAKNQKLATAYFKSPVGWMKVQGGRALVTGAEFVKTKGQEVNPEKLKGVVRQLEEYFVGGRKKFDLKVEFEGTEFQRKVWVELTKIPYGKTITYGELARRIGNPRAMRAVGTANGKNCMPVVVPCHRVIASGGKLGGYSGGLDKKRWLLKHEGVAVR